MPVPTAPVADHVRHVILSRIAVESPESGQPEPHAGIFSKVPLMSWPSARKVLVPVGEAVTPGEAGGLADATAELPEELQAATSKAAQAIQAQPAARRALRPLMVNMDFQPLNSQLPIAARMSHVTYTTAAVPPWLGRGCGGAGDTNPFGLISAPGLSEALALAPVRRHRVDLPVVTDHVVL